MPPTTDIAPRDILPIPYFALQVSAAEAAAIIGVVAALCYLFIFFSRRLRRKKMANVYPLIHEAFSAARRALQSPGGNPSELKAALARVSMTVKRYLTVYEGRAISSGSARDLQELLQNEPQGTLRSILEHLLALEEVKYAPRVTVEPARELVADLESCVHDYHRQRRGPA